MALHAVIEPYCRRPDDAVVAGKIDDLFCREPGDFRDALRRILAGPHRKLLESQRVAVDIVAVDQMLVDQHVHHAQGQRGVSPGH